MINSSDKPQSLTQEAGQVQVIQHLYTLSPHMHKVQTSLAPAFESLPPLHSPSGSHLLCLWSPCFTFHLLRAYIQYAWMGGIEDHSTHPYSQRPTIPGQVHLHMSTVTLEIFIDSGAAGKMISASFPKKFAWFLETLFNSFLWTHKMTPWGSTRKGTSFIILSQAPSTLIIGLDPTTLPSFGLVLLLLTHLRVLLSFLVPMSCKPNHFLCYVQDYLPCLGSLNRLPRSLFQAQCRSVTSALSL